MATSHLSLALSFTQTSSLSLLSPLSPSMATVHTSTPAKSLLLNPSTTRPRFKHPAHHTPSFPCKPLRKLSCRATETSKVQEEEPKAGPTVSGGGNANWVPVIPLSALPKGERRVIVQGGDVVLLLWYKDQVFAIENRSPAEGAYSEGLLNAKLTQDGCIVCPTTESTFDLRTGEIKDWYPKNPVLRILTPVLRKLYRYPVKLEGENIFIGMEGGSGSGTVPSAEIVFTGRAQIGITSSDVNVEEVRMVVDEESEGFGFSTKNESINGRAAIVGFLLLIDFELLTGKGLLKGTGFLDFIYAVSGLLS